MPNVNVFLTGNTLPGADPRTAAAALAKATGASPDQALALLTSGKPRLLKRGLTPEAARTLAERFAALGIATALREARAEGAKAAPRAEPTPPPEAAETPEAPEAPAAPVSLAKKAATPAGPEPEDEDFNPYRAPRADMEETRPRPEGTWLERGKVVPAGHGFKWLGEAWRLFKERPGVWIGGVLLSTILVAGGTGLLAALGPRAAMLSNVLSFLLWVVFYGGMALMAHAQMRGEAIGVGMIFDGFRRRFRALLALGALILLTLLAVGAVIGVIAAVLLPSLRVGSPGGFMIVFLVGALFAAAVLTPPLIASCAAPTLTTVAERDAWPSLVQLCGAVNRNWRAILVNAVVVGAVPFLLALSGIVVAIVIPQAAKAGAGLSDGLVMFSVVVLVLLALLALPLFFLMPILYYTATRDIFYEEGRP